jgi:small subunit ribosomal protein S1
MPDTPQTPHGKTPLPNLRAALPPELEAEVQAALGGLSLEEILRREAPAPLIQELEAESRHLARVVRVTRDTVFVDLGGRHQGMLPLAQLTEPPAEGAQIDVVINRFDAEEGLYHVSLPSAAAAVGDWSSVAEGMVVEARVTGVNKGGLECDVSNLRGFIPASQAAAWRVDDLESLVGERLLCVVTEVDPERRKLVLSRRAMIEREREEARQKLRAELAEGQVREGVVRSLQDFGAFVDLGGVDGLIHISQLSWQRVQHPSEVLHVGQRVRVKVRKLDPETGKLSLSLRDLTESPWATAAMKYPPTSRHQGVVTRLAAFGAFVELEPGLEGMVHISELAHGRVWRASDVVKPGQQVEVQVLAVDPIQQRISLSLKAVQAKPEPAPPPQEEPDEPAPQPPPPPRKTPLRGGLDRSSGGERFGLKW